MSTSESDVELSVLKVEEGKKKKENDSDEDGTSSKSSTPSRLSGEEEKDKGKKKKGKKGDKEKDNRGKDLLKAVENEDLEEVTRLLGEEGLPLEYRDKKTGRTPLCTALTPQLEDSDTRSRKIGLEIAELLIIHGADVHACDNGGISVLAVCVAQSGRLLQAEKIAFQTVRRSQKHTKYLKFQALAREILDSASFDSSALRMRSYSREGATVIQSMVDTRNHILLQHFQVRGFLRTKWWPWDRSGKRAKEVAKTIVLVHHRKTAVQFFSSGVAKFGVATVIYAIFVTCAALWAFTLSNENSNGNIEMMEAYNDLFVHQKLPFIAQENEWQLNFPDIETTDQVYLWLKGPVADGAFASLVGTSFNERVKFRVRQLRAKTKECQVAENGRRNPGPCVLDWTSANEETERDLPASFNATHPDIVTPAFTQHIDARTTTFTTIHINTYPVKGGFEIEVDSNWTKTLFLEVIQDLEENQWIDQQTSLLAVEILGYNRNSDKVVLLRLVIEFSSSGKLLPSAYYLFAKNHATPQWGFEIVLIVILIYFLAIEISELVAMKSIPYFFQKKWHYVDISIIVSTSAALFLHYAYLVRRSDREDISASSLNSWSSNMAILQASRGFITFALVLMFMNSMQYLRIFRPIGMMLRILVKMLYDLFAFLMLLWFIQFSFAVGWHVTVGDQVRGFETLWLAWLTTVRMTFGDFDYLKFYAANNYVALGIYYAYLAIIVILMLNLLIAQMNKSYSDVVEHARREFMIESSDITLTYSSNVGVIHSPKAEKAHKVEESKVQITRAKAVKNKATIISANTMVLSDEAWVFSYTLGQS